MAITIRRSTDVGAPVLTNVAGSLVTLLDHLLVTGLGYTKTVFSANIVKYQMPVGTNGFSLQVKDTATGSAQVQGWEVLTAADTGTGSFPTLAQAANNIYIDKPATCSWRFISDGKMFYLFIKVAASATQYCFAFGDIKSYKAGDAYHTAIIGNVSAANATANMAALTVLPSPAAGHFVARSFTQIGTAITAGKFSDTARNGAVSALGSGGGTYPNPVDGSLKLAPVWVFETTAGVQERGLLPGIFNPLHTAPLADGDVFSVSSGSLSGRAFEIVITGTAQFAVETTDTWGGF